MDAPPSTADSGRLPRDSWNRRLLRGLVLVLGLAISLSLAATTNRMLRQEAVAQDALTRQSLIAGLQGHIEQELDVLTGLGGLFEASEQVTAHEFARFAHLDHHIEADSSWLRVGWVERIPGPAPAAPDGASDELLSVPLVVRYLNPGDAGGPLQDIDLKNIPASLAAMRKAVATRELAVTEPLDLPLTSTTSPAILAFHPVFKTADDGVSSLFAGFVFGAYALDGLIGSHLDINLPEGGPKVQVHAGTVTIFQQGTVPPDTESLPLTVGDHTWSVQIDLTTPTLQAATWVPALVFLFGLAVSILLFLHLQRIDGEYGRISAEVHAATRELADANHALAERSAALQDLAEDLRRTSNEAQLANSAKTMFLANMSHELRTPLNAMIGFSEIISRQLFGNELDRYTGYAQDIHNSGLHLLSIIEDLLDMSRIELGTLKVEATPARPEQLVDDIVRLLRHRAQEQGVQIVCKDLDSLPEMELDTRAMRQALINLIGNAIKFSGPGTIVTISGRRAANGDVILAVADQGVGIAEEQLAHIFDPFWQADATRRQARGGVGLGLAITRRLIEAHDGTIVAESKLNSGTTMAMRLPASRVLQKSRGARTA